LRGTHDAHRATSSEIEDAFITQDVQRTYDSILVHPEYRREVNRRWQSLAWSDFAVHDCASNLCDHLIVQSTRFRAINAD